MTEIRAADIGDAELLTQLIREAFADLADRFGLTQENCPTNPAFTTPDDQRAAMAKGISYYVLHDEDGPVGCVALDTRDPDEPCLARLGVLRERRGRGYGRALVEHVIEEVRSRSLRRVVIGVIAEHHELVGWYEGLGFEKDQIRHFDHLPFEVRLMELDLGKG